MGALLLRSTDAGRLLTSATGGLGGVAAVLVIVETIYLILQTALWLRYRPYPGRASAELPRLTVVIPAFNEGPMVERSIGSVAVRGLPRTTGWRSSSSTTARATTRFFHMQKLRRAYPVLGCASSTSAGNQGKRRGARAPGSSRARPGEVVLTLDSDSEIERRDAASEMVAPFARRRRRRGRRPRHGAEPRQRCIGRDARRAVHAQRSTSRRGGAVDVPGRSMVLPGRPVRRSGARSSLPLLDGLDGPAVPGPAGRPRRGSGPDQHRASRPGYDTVYQAPRVSHAGAEPLPPALAHAAALGPQLHRRGLQLRALHVRRSAAAAGSCP